MFIDFYHSRKCPTWTAKTLKKYIKMVLNPYRCFTLCFHRCHNSFVSPIKMGWVFFDFILAGFCEIGTHFFDEFCRFSSLFEMIQWQKHLKKYENLYRENIFIILPAAFPHPTNRPFHWFRRSHFDLRGVLGRSNVQFPSNFSRTAWNVANVQIHRTRHVQNLNEIDLKINWLAISFITAFQNVQIAVGSLWSFPPNFRIADDIVGPHHRHVWLGLRIWHHWLWLVQTMFGWMTCRWKWKKAAGNLIAFKLL